MWRFARSSRRRAPPFARTGSHGARTRRSSRDRQMQASHSRTWRGWDAFDCVELVLFVMSDAIPPVTHRFLYVLPRTRAAVLVLVPPGAQLRLRFGPQPAAEHECRFVSVSISRTIEVEAPVRTYIRSRSPVFAPVCL